MGLIERETGKNIFTYSSFSLSVFFVVVSEGNFLNHGKTKVFVQKKINLFRKHKFIENG